VIKTEIGAYEAKTKLPELLREVRKGRSFTITNRGQAIADLIPAADSRSADKVRAVEAMQEFIRTHRRVRGVNINELIEEGRD